jgi:hypothetical protein
MERAGADQDRDFFAGIENIGGPARNHHPVG